MYRLNKNDYQNLLRNAITMNGTGNSFVSFKDREESFIDHPTKRLINQFKNEIGRIMKRF